MRLSFWCVPAVCGMVVIGPPARAQSPIRASGPPNVLAVPACAATLTVGPLAGLAGAQPPFDPDAQRPMTEPELQEFLQALEPVKLRDGDGQAIRAVSGSQLKMDRLAV